MDDFFAERFFNSDYDHSSPLEPSHSLYTLSYGTIRDILFVDALRFGVPPSTIEGDPTQHICLQVAAEAYADYVNNRHSVIHNHAKVGVIIGKGDHPHRGLIAGLLHGIGIEQTTDILINALRIPRTKQNNRILRNYLGERISPAYDRNLVPNLISNVISGTVANKLGFMGPNLLVDAACTSALVGLDYGLNLLSSNTCDAILIGGAQATINVPIYELFSALEALSSSTVRPMCSEPNGTLLSEGIGFVVVKRLEDAIANNDRIYSIIDGLGISSDGRGQGLLAPNTFGQLTAINRAYEKSSLSKKDISLIEVHATGIRHGDETELVTLKEAFRERNSSLPYIPLTSVKSIIGHCIPASGMASIIKLSLCLYKRQMIAGIAPEPIEALSYEDSIFYMLKHDSYWENFSSSRACAMNSFGFGGINGHLILKESTQLANPQNRHTVSSAFKQSDPKDIRMFHGILKDRVSPDLPFYCVSFSVSSWQELRSFLHKFKSNPKISHGLTEIGDTKCDTLTIKGFILSSSIDEFCGSANEVLSTLKAQPSSCTLLKGRNWLFRYLSSYKNDDVCFLIPGEGSPSVKSVNSQLLSISIFRSWLEDIDSVSGKDFSLLSLVRSLCSIEQNDQHKKNNLLQLLFRTDIATQIQALSVFAFAETLRKINVIPRTLIGHSAGEADAIVLSGLAGPTDRQSIMKHLNHLNDFYRHNPNDYHLHAGQCYAITGLNPDQVNELCRNTEGLYVVSINSPTQSVVYSLSENSFSPSVFSDSQCLIHKTQLVRPYHTPHFKEQALSYQTFYDTLLPDSPSTQCSVISCLDSMPYPTNDRTGIISKLIDQWHHPVRFYDSLLYAYDNGARLFIEVGQSSILTSYARESLSSHDDATFLSLGSTSPDPYHIIRSVMSLWVYLEEVDIRTFFEDILCDISLDSQPIYNSERHIPIPSSTPFIDTTDLYQFLSDSDLLPTDSDDRLTHEAEDLSKSVNPATCRPTNATNISDSTHVDPTDIDIALRYQNDVCKEILTATEKAALSLLKLLP